MRGCPPLRNFRFPHLVHTRKAPLALDAFVCVAALSNLAFQCTIPGQRESKLFRTNLNQFAAGYCTDLVDGRPFALE